MSGGCTFNKPRFPFQRAPICGIFDLFFQIPLVEIVISRLREFFHGPSRSPLPSVSIDSTRFSSVLKFLS